MRQHRCAETRRQPDDAGQTSAQAETAVRSKERAPSKIPAPPPPGRYARPDPQQRVPERARAPGTSESLTKEAITQRLVWSDEFTGIALYTAKPTTRTNTRVGYDLACSTHRPQNIVVANGT
jgi:hypothetical protein